LPFLERTSSSMNEYLYSLTSPFEYGETTMAPKTQPT
jgi:hypothetical protein